MRAKLIISCLVMVILVSLFVVFKQEVLKAQQIHLNELDIDFQNAINQLRTKPNIYLITKGSNIILYSNLQKSGLYTFPYAVLKKDGEKLIIQIESHLTADEDYPKDELIARINLTQLPNQIEASFLGYKTEYKIITLKE
jgi:hypothetical protein